MADDIVSRLRSENRMALAPIHMSDAADEIVRLRAERDALRITISDLTAEVERLRAAGDALAESLTEFHDPQDDLRLLAWQEARRGRT